MYQWRFGVRLNSFRSTAHQGTVDNGWSTPVSVLIPRAASVNGVTDVDLNYPEHFCDNSVHDVRENLRRVGLRCHGVALRYGAEFSAGDFTNPDDRLRRRAIEITLQAANVCRQLGGEVVTLWFAHDGTDYPFEADYQQIWRAALAAVSEVASCNPDLQIAIEYKPYQPRSFALFGDVGTVLTAIHAIALKNVGITLDYCHMRMKRENPTFSLALAAAHGRLLGVHLNDGYGDNDDGMMIGSVNPLRLIEFIYYLKRCNYRGMIYFDTFPQPVDPAAECRANIQTFLAAERFLERMGVRRMRDAIEGRNPLKSQELLVAMLNGR